MKINKFKISKICDLIKGDYKTLKTEPGEYPLVVTAEARRSSKTYQLEGPAVCIPLVSSTGHGHAAIHRIHYQEGKFALANLLVALLPTIDKIFYPRYLYHLLMAKKDELLIPLMSGTANVSLKIKDIANVEVSLPEIYLQKKIVKYIEYNLKRINMIKSLRNNVLDDADAILDNVIINIYNDGKNSGWKEHNFGEYIMNLRYGTSQKTSEETFGTPILNMYNIQNGKLVTNKLKYLHLTDKQKNKLLLKRGDIIINRTNSAKLVGKCAVFNLEGQYGYASYLIRIRVDPLRADPDFIAYYLNSSLGRSYMFKERKQMTGQANINSKTIRDLPIALPQILEQRKIVEYLDELKECVESLKNIQESVNLNFDQLSTSIRFNSIV